MQCGKSTFTSYALPELERLDLERPSDVALLNADLEGLFAERPEEVDIDDAQRLPELAFNSMAMGALRDTLHLSLLKFPDLIQQALGFLQAVADHAALHGFGQSRASRAS